MKDFNEKLSTYINRAITDHNGDISIQPSTVAMDVIKQLNPVKETDPIILWGFNLQVRSLARTVLGKKYDPTEKENSNQVEMFSGLQNRYPVKRTNESEYVLRESLTLDERNINENKLRKTGAAFIEHADALRAETAHLIDGGHFQDEHLPIAINDN